MNVKPSVILLVGLCGSIVCAIVYFNRHKTPPAAVPIVESTPTPTAAPPEKITVTAKAALPVVAVTPEPAPSPATNSVANNSEFEATTAFRKTIDALLSPQLSPRLKHELFEQLRNAGQLDQAITELKQRATDDPNNPEIPTTLGEAQLNKLRAIRATGGDANEIGILAMQADQSFNAALKIDPSNWEAQFVKYTSMSRWPADATRDNEVARKLSSLVDQQDALPQQPQFAQTYVVLGEQYQKIGKPDYAETTWRLGLTKFPNDPTLQKKLAPRP